MGLVKARAPDAIAFWANGAIVGGLKFERGENERQVWYCLEHEDVSYLVLQNKEMPVPCWYIIAHDLVSNRLADNRLANDRLTTLNNVTYKLGGKEIDHAGPLYVGGEPAVEYWLKALADYILAGNNPWSDRVTKKKREEIMTNVEPKTKQVERKVGSHWVEGFDGCEFQIGLGYHQGRYRLSACPVVDWNGKNVITSPLDGKSITILEVNRRSKKQDEIALSKVAQAQTELLLEVAAKGIAVKKPGAEVAIAEPGIPEPIRQASKHIADSYDDGTVIVFFLAALPNRWFLLRPSGVAAAQWAQADLTFIDPIQGGAVWNLGQRLGELEVPTTRYAGDASRTYDHSRRYQCYELEAEGDRPDVSGQRLVSYPLREEQLEE